MDDKTKASTLKDEGNAAMTSKNFTEAIYKYTQAIELDPKNHVLYSNRSAAYASLEKYSDALADAEETVKLKPDWMKGYSRKGAALTYLKRYQEAVETYEAGLKVEPANKQLKEALEECKSKKSSPPTPPGMNPFNDPTLLAKLAVDPRTREYMKDPEFVKTMQQLQTDPKSLGARLNDKRVITALSVLLGMNIGDPSMDDDADLNGADEPTSPAKKKPASPPPQPKPEKMDVDETPERQKAINEKEAGNAAYKKKDFGTALSHYDKAIEIDPSDITFYTNKAAVYYEMKRYADCAEICDKAVEVGRENRTDFKLIAKAFARAGNAYKAAQDYAKAKIYYEKALSEHRTPETKELLSKVEKLIKEQERLAYIDPEKAEVEKEKGNEAFKKGDFPGALKFYTEAIKRNPDDAKLYSNRAACYTKLAEFNLGLKDCDECIRLDPNFIKGHIRKGKILHGLKQYSKAQEAYQKALQIDPSSQEAIDGLSDCMTALNSDPEEVRKRAMADPEVQQILKDPAMRMILEQMQNDPRALQDHLRNPDIASKIQKLYQSGLISIR